MFTWRQASKPRLKTVTSRSRCSPCLPREGRARREGSATPSQQELARTGASSTQEARPREHIDHRARLGASRNFSPQNRLVILRLGDKQKEGVSSNLSDPNTAILSRQQALNIHF